MDSRILFFCYEFHNTSTLYSVNVTTVTRALTHLILLVWLQYQVMKKKKKNKKKKMMKKKKKKKKKKIRKKKKKKMMMKKKKKE